jgi:hypothetical protein
MTRHVLWIPALALLTGCGGPFMEVAPDDPLGKFEAIEKYLVEERGFKKTEDTLSKSECFWNEALLERLETLKTYRYKNVNQAGNIHVKVAVDDSGRVHAVAGRFNSRRAVWTDGGEKTETFVCLLWKEVAGTEPAFTKKERPETTLQEFLLAEFDAGKVAGRWEKSPTGTRVSNTHSLWDDVLIWRK